MRKRDVLIKTIREINAMNNILNKMDEYIEVLEQESDNILPKNKTKMKLSFEFDQKLFDKMANFIINLEPERLEDNQVEEIINIINDIETEIETEDIQELKNPKLAKRTIASKNQASKKWYRANRTKIKRRKQKFRRSSEGRKREKSKERLSRQGRTSTGRKKVRYHTRKRSDRRDEYERRTYGK